MLAICIGDYFNISNDNMQQSIENYIPSNNRSQIIKTRNNTLILDAYNANPSSMKAMLLSFSEQNYANKICILGDMLELGRYSKKEHQKITLLCKTLNLNCYFIGEEFKRVNEKAFKNRQDFERKLKEEVMKGKTILLKGSRGMGLEKLVEHL
jgi:UDP-N-acetylmuramoyl-tripeptide--D-alanyl-D-alanine ligase